MKMKRQLDSTEKSLTLKNLRRNEKDLEMLQLQKEILESQIETLPKTIKLNIYAKNEELRRTDLQIESLEKSIEISKKQITEGVETNETKSETTQKDTDVSK